MITREEKEHTRETEQTRTLKTQHLSIIINNNPAQIKLSLNTKLKYTTP